MTRARDHLVVSLHRKVKNDCHAARIAARLAEEAFTELLELEPGRPPALPRPTRGQAPASADLTAREQWLAARAVTLERAEQPSSISATAIAKHGDDPKDTVDDVDTPPWRRGRAGTAIGRAVHAVLQTVDLASGAGLVETARAQALAEQVPDREAEIRTLTESVLAAPIVRSATAAGARCWREVPVGAQINGVLVEGFIDLLIEDGDGFTIVDYKTDQVPSDDDVAAAVARYTPQGAAYAVALEAVLGRPIRRCVFVFARATEVMEHEVQDLPAAVTEVRERLVSQGLVPLT
jgi:ATP-dependent helicase/nuclease subunit A